MANSKLQCLPPTFITMHKMKVEIKIFNNNQYLLGLVLNTNIMFEPQLKFDPTMF